MALSIQLGNNPLVPLKEAVKVVPYSRDYIARLAREGKIVALQFERQWLIDSVSLKNFYDQAKIEEGVRRQLLSDLRRREIEIRDTFVASLQNLEKRQEVFVYRTHTKTAMVMLCGLCAGILFYVSFMQLDAGRMNMIAQIPSDVLAYFWVEPAARVADGSVVASRFYEAVEVTETLDLSNGILLAPASSTEITDIQELFSDQVTVEMTSTTTGVVYLNDANQTSLPFVRVASPAESDGVSPPMIP